MADCLGINRNTAYTIVRRGKYKNLPKFGSYNQKIEWRSYFGRCWYSGGQSTDDIAAGEFCVRSGLTKKKRFTQHALSKALEGRMITFKIARDCPAERNSEENIEDQYTYTLWIKRPDVISSRNNFVDEIGVNILMRRTQGRSAKGDRV